GAEQPGASGGPGRGRDSRHGRVLSVEAAPRCDALRCDAMRCDAMRCGASAKYSTRPTSRLRQIPRFFPAARPLLDVAASVMTTFLLVEAAGLTHAVPS
ncbi:MAG: hypothetical protein AAF928_20220, partial [Myxococcota bacterium]